MQTLLKAAQCKPMLTPPAAAHLHLLKLLLLLQCLCQPAWLLLRCDA